MRFQRLDDWLRWQESHHPKAIDLGLARVSAVAQAMQLLTPTATVITVAGTNGKGSCVAALEALILAAGKTCGAYTSPHLLRYNERVRLGAQTVSDADLCDAFAAIDKARGEHSLTYFEFGTLAALWLFARQPLDFWLLEVGLGGRLDAVNILDPDLTIITSIALDHEEWLGSDRESIGREKAGICRAGVPLICADREPPASIRQIANTLACPAYWIGSEFDVSADAQDGESALRLAYTTPVVDALTPETSGTAKTLLLDRVHLPKTSLAAAVQAAALLGLPLSGRILSDLHLNGRLQAVPCGEQDLVVDVAHNPAAMTHLAAQLAQQYPQRPIVWVLAMMADKRVDESLAALAPLAAHWLLSTIPGLPRAASVAQLSQALDRIPSSAAQQTSASVAEALPLALAQAATIPDALIVVTGSFYTVAAALDWLAAHTIEPDSASHKPHQTGDAR